jgi:hypothetical protein
MTAGLTIANLIASPHAESNTLRHGPASTIFTRRRNFPRWRASHGLRGTPPPDRLRWRATNSCAPHEIRRDRRKAWLRGAIGQRSPPVFPSVARRPDGPVLRTGGHRTDGPDDHGGPPSRPGTGGARQEHGRHRHPLRRPARRRRGPRLIRQGLRRRRCPLRGTLEAAR